MAIFPQLIKRSSLRASGPLDDFWYQVAVPGGGSAAVRVDEKTALKYLTVFACVSLIAGDIARLPLNLYRKRKDGGKDLITDHRLYDLLHNAPNDEMTSFNWREAGQGHLLLWGNHYSYKEKDKTGKIRALWPIHDPGQVKVYRSGDKIIYEYRVDNDTKYRTRDDIFHIPGYGFNGLYGLSMISLARQAVGMGLSMEEFGGRYFSEGTHPSGLLTTETPIGEGEEDYIKALKASYSGLGKSHGIMLLQNGEKYTPFTVKMEDAQFLESRDHQKIEICGMYHVPPHKIAIHGQNSNYNNLEQENASYVDSCLMHWIVRWESAISQQLLTEQERRSGLFFEFQVQGLLRGDSQARAEYYSKLFGVGGLSPNKILSFENMNPIEGGDQHFIPLNMVPLNMAGEMVKPPEESPQKEVEPEEEKKAIRDFWQDNRSKSSIVLRDRIAKRYYPLFKDAAQQIVNREVNAIKRQTVKYRKLINRSKEFDAWLKEFYRDLPDYIRLKLGATFEAYSDAIKAAACDEIGSDPDDIDLKQFTKEYIDRYVERHIESSEGQIMALKEDGYDAIEERVDEWSVKRPEKIAQNETSRLSNAVFQAAAFYVGMSTIWRIRGPRTCPYCKELSGKRISKGGSYVNAGDSINPEGEEPMKVYKTIRHCPAHYKCDCYLSTI